jgi:hypothetical protein
MERLAIQTAQPLLRRHDHRRLLDELAHQQFDGQPWILLGIA